MVDAGRAIPFFQLDDDGDETNSLSSSIEFPNLVPDIFNITEVDPGVEWDLTDVQCVNKASGIAHAGSLVSGATVSIVQAVGDDVVCTYTNTKRGTILISKVTEPANSSGSFGFDGGVELGSLGSISDGGTITIADLVTGAYTVTEDGPIYTNNIPDYFLTSVTCEDQTHEGASAIASDGDIRPRTATINLDPSETVQCTFINTKPGTITVVKTTDPDPDPYGTALEFNVKSGASLYPADVSFSLYSGGTVTVEGLYPGDYAVSEGAADSPWVLDSLVCTYSDGSTAEFGGGKADVILTADGSVTCTFHNIIQIHPGSHGFWKNWSNHYSEEILELFLLYLEENNPKVYTGIVTGSGPTIIDSIYDFGQGDSTQALLAELTALKLDLAASHLEYYKKPGDPTDYLRHDYISLECTVDLSRTDLSTVAGVAELEGYTFIYDFFSENADQEVGVGAVVDGIEGVWTGASPITSNPDDWSFAISNDVDGLTAEQKKALLFRVLYDIIHGVNLPYADGSPCFPPVITTDTLTDEGAGPGHTATLTATGGVTPYTWESANLPTGLSIATRAWRSQP